MQHEAVRGCECMQGLQGDSMLRRSVQIQDAGRNAHAARAARRFIYSKTRDVCEELDSVGVHYGTCLGEHDDCVDPPPGSSFPPRPAARPWPRKGSFRLRQKAFADGLPTLVFNGTVAWPESTAT